MSPFVPEGIRRDILSLAVGMLKNTPKVSEGLTLCIFLIYDELGSLSPSKNKKS